MDGKTLKEMLAFEINEPVTSSFLDSKTSYDFLYEAACEYNRLTQALNWTQTITTVADSTVTSYILNPDFLCLRLYNDRNELVVKFEDDETVPNVSFIPLRPYEQVIQALNTDSVDFPSNCAITDYQLTQTNITGTASSTSTSADPATLPCTTGGFVVNGITVGDFIHNTTDGSHGIVTEVSGATQLKTALFYGVTNYWTSANAFTIVKQGRKVLVMDPPTATAGYTITVDYVQKPTPVYTSYGAYRFDSTAMFAIVKYAAFMYKYRDRVPNFGDALYKAWLAQVTAATAMTNKAYDRTRFRANFIKRSLYDRSFR
jgi:ABC-type phosphate/phosphonate transport system substrate-binding protein